MTVDAAGPQEQEPSSPTYLPTSPVYEQDEARTGTPPMPALVGLDELNEEQDRDDEVDGEAVEERGAACSSCGGGGRR